MTLLMWSQATNEETEIERDDTWRTATDRELGDAAFYADAQIIEHRELDADTDGLCDRCRAANEALDAIKAETARRDEEGIEIRDTSELTLEERLGAYGEEWQIEQRERQEAGW